MSRLFTWRTVLNEGADLTTAEYAVGMAIATVMNEAGDGAWPKVETIARYAKCSSSTARKAVNGLEEKGYLEVKRSTGRGHSNEYTARDPSQESHRETAAFLGAGTAATDASDAHQRASASTPAGGLSEPTESAERRREPVAFSGAEDAVSRTERHRLEGVKPPAAGAHHVGPRQDHDSSSNGPVDAAAVELRGRLTGHGLDGELLAAALADAERATAWIALAETSADLNVGGYFRAGFQRGGWPGPRITSSAITTLERRRRDVAQLVENLGVDGPDEARYRIDREWETLTQVERAELHELVDELASDQLPEPPVAPAGTSEVA